jgi:hypothetical protein
LPDVVRVAHQVCNATGAAGDVHRRLALGETVILVGLAVVMQLA